MMSTIPFKKINSVSKNQRSCVLGLFSVIIILCSIAPSTAQVSSISYTFSPSAERVSWAGNAGLSNGNLIGGSIGLGFGEIVQLSGLYHWGNNFDTDFSAFSNADENILDLVRGFSARSVDLRRVGGVLRFNFAEGALVPFATVGTGLMRFQPNGLPEFESIYLSGSIGLSYSLADRYTLSLQLQNLSYRYNPSAFFAPEDLAGLADGTQIFKQTRVSNWGLGGSLSLFLGGRKPGQLSEIDRAFRDQFTSGLRGLSWTIKPFIGQISFNEALGFRKIQSVAGIDAGIHMGPYLGVRGFYWRGLDQGDLDDVQFFGGEMQFNLSQAEGVVPFLLFGGGYADVKSGYSGENGNKPDDTPFAIGGGGLILPVSPRAKIHAGVRAMLISGNDIADVSKPSQIRTSYLYTGGVTFAIGGVQAPRPELMRRQVAEDEIARIQVQAATREEKLRTALMLSRARADSLKHEMLMAQVRGDSAAVMNIKKLHDQQEETYMHLASALEPVTETEASRQPDLEAEKEAKQTSQDSLEAQTGALQTREGDRTVSIPLPEEGEIYIRYGAPTNVNIKSAHGPRPTQIQAPLQSDSSLANVIARQEILRNLIDQQNEWMTERRDSSENRLSTDSLSTNFQTQTLNALRATSEQSVVAQIEERLEEMENRMVHLQQDRMRSVNSADSMYKALHEQMQALKQQEAGNLKVEQLDYLEKRLGEQFESRFQQLKEELQGLESEFSSQGESMQPVVVIPEIEQQTTPQTILVTDGQEDATSTSIDAGAYQFSGLHPYVGFNLSSDPNQLLLGFRGHWDQLFWKNDLRFMPELVLGLGGGSTLLNPNLYLVLPVFDFPNAQPYIGGGAGLIGFFSAPDETEPLQAALNFIVGSEFEIRENFFFVEYANVDLSTFHRFQLGYRLQF